MTTPDVSLPHTLVILNPAAGGGRAGRDAAPLLDRLGPHVLARTDGPGHAATLARDTDAARVVAVGGDGTLHEVVNGLMRRTGARPALGILPVGTGNSFVRDLGLAEPNAAVAALLADRRRPVDVVRVDHADGPTWSINLVSIGFTAEAGAIMNRRFKPLGAAGYVAGVVVAVGRLRHPVYRYALDDGPFEDRPCTLISFSNSQYTGGQMHMAPPADPTDGLVDVVRVGGMSRRRLLTAFPKIFAGTHVHLPEVRLDRAARVRFDLHEPIDLMIDGEILRALPTGLTVEHAALEVVA